MTKVEIIENKSHDELKELFASLTDLLGYTEVLSSDCYLTAIEKGKISNISWLFIFPKTKLSGNNDIEELVSLIESCQKKINADKTVIVSNYHISNGTKISIAKHEKNIMCEYIGRDDLIEMIDNNWSDFWRHDDPKLISYEQQFKDSINEENQLKKLHLSNDKYEKLVNIFIQPTMLQDEEDEKTHTYVRKRISFDNILNDKKCAIISGISGSGKSTLLKNAGLSMIDNNAKKEGRKIIPVYISATDLLQYCRNIDDVLNSKLSMAFGIEKYQELIDLYDIVILIDSIDEFDEKEKESIVKRLTNIYKNKGIRFLLGSRSITQTTSYIDSKIVNSFRISRFNIDQIRRFVTAFIPSENKVNNLMESLRENKILERLPITPQTLSLLSILYDETDYEVPATITDVYKKFNNLIVGFDIVSTKIEYVDVSFRERILSMYSLLLMEKHNHEPLTIDEFKKHFCDYYAGKTLPIKDAQLTDVLDYLINNTGIIYIKEGKWVCFSHDSYMEYYAAVEIFYYHREKEISLIDCFFDPMWQNTAVFYAGITKDMEDFATKINDKLKEGRVLMDYISGVQGAGYLLQALYQTDNTIRKEIILTSLNLALETNEYFKKMATINKTMLQNYKLPIIQTINFLHFYEMFNSLTLKEPLRLAFNELKSEYEKTIESNNFDSYMIPALGYKLMELAFTLDSKRICDDSGLDYILAQKELLKDSNLLSLATLSFDLLGKNGYNALKEEIRKKYASIEPVCKALFDESTGKIRFSILDTIHPHRKVKIFVEGKTDAQILDHAYLVLSGGKQPYWNITMASMNGDTGSSSAVSNAIEASISYADDYDYIIALYDHDEAGLKEFRRLERDYDVIEVDTIKKRKGFNIYLLCMPVPGEMKHYLQEKQSFNFFEIEHYFGHEFLSNNKVLKEKETLPNIYEIKDKDKTSFAATVSNNSDPKVFKYFVDLFHCIDRITQTEVDYIEANEG